MRRILLFLLMVTALTAASVAPLAAQDIDVAFSDERLRALNYPEIEISVGPDGVVAPSSLEAGYYLVSLSAASGYSAYMNIMVPPEGLDEETATEQALAAARDDLVQPGWQYFGGANTFQEGVPVSFAIYLAPGEYSIAASYYLPEQGSEEVMTLVPLTVTQPGAASSSAATPVAGTPSASPVARTVSVQPPIDVELLMTDDLQYIVDPDPVEAGPQLWQIRNTGTMHSHHVVMWEAPEGTTAEDIIADYDSAFAGTPPAEDSLVTSLTYVGYAALQSGGATTWFEFDLEPGTYAVICYIIDPETGRPHFADGMVTVFTVE